MPIACSIAVADKEIKLKDDILIMGELELSGKLRAVSNVYAACQTAISMGIKKCIVPKAKLGDALKVDGMKVYGA